MRKKLVSTEEKIHYIANGDGEIIDQNTTYTTKISSTETEPKYVKLYLEDVTRMQGLTGNQNNILMGILQLTTFSTNEVILNKYNREKIADSVGANDQVIRNAISNLVKREILFKIATGVYRLNPFLFGSGSWQNIKGLRMTVEYTQQGKTIQVEEMFDNEVACTLQDVSNR